MIDKLYMWMINSSQFKKWNGIIGGFCLGLWFSAMYWKEIRATLEIWGISKDQWLNLLIGIAGVCGIGISMGLTAAKNRIIEKKKRKINPS